MKRTEANAVRVVLYAYVLSSDGVENKAVDKIDIGVRSSSQKRLELASEGQMMLA